MLKRRVGAACAALRYLEVMRHLQQQAFAQDAAFELQELELLVLMARSDVVHALGGDAAACGRSGAAASRALQAPATPVILTARLRPPAQMCRTRRTPCWTPTCSASRTPHRGASRAAGMRGAPC